jgi:hypothetical protein
MIIIRHVRELFRMILNVHQNPDIPCLSLIRPFDRNPEDHIPGLIYDTRLNLNTPGGT